MDDINTLRRILRESRVIAVVGLSADWYRPSYFAAKKLGRNQSAERPTTAIVFAVCRMRRSVLMSSMVRQL